MMESNLKTAKALELTIPQSLLQQVTRAQARARPFAR